MSHRLSGAHGALLLFLLVGSTALAGAGSRHTRLSRPDHHMGAVFPTARTAGADAAVSAQPAGKTPVNAVFRPILARLKEVTIPVLLPTTLPRQSQADSHLRLYAEVSDLTPYAYRVDLGFSPGCRGATACRYGEVTGGPVIDTPTIFDYPRGRHVRLRNGALALFFPFSCGASCGDSVLVFQAEGVVYTVSVKAGSLNDVLTIANSVTTA